MKCTIFCNFTSTFVETFITVFALQDRHFQSIKWHQYDCLCQKIIRLRNIKSVWKWMSLYKWPFYDLLWPFFCNMYVHLSQNWGSDGHFGLLNRSYLSLVQKLWHKTQIFSFLLFFVVLQKNRSFVFCIFCVFCHHFCTNEDLDSLSTSKWPS